MAQPEDHETLPKSPRQDEPSPSNSPSADTGADANASQAEEVDEAAQEELAEKLRREREARAQALTLEIVGDLPFAEVKPPENVLFVCKLNPVTEDDDLDLIFSRFGKIISCEVIRDKRTGDSLQYAFIEFEDQKACEQAYFKMQGVLIDDHRIHVDFSQSVSRLSDTWRSATNSKRAKQAGGFGGVANLEKKRQYRAIDADEKESTRNNDGYDMIMNKDDLRNKRYHQSKQQSHRRYQSRSRSPRRDNRRERVPPRRNSDHRGHGSGGSRRDNYGHDRRRY